METIFNVIVVITRGATNMLAVPVWSGIFGAIGQIVRGEGLLAGFYSGWAKAFEWSFHTAGGWIVAGIFGVLGIVHSLRAASAGSYWGILGFVGFLFDNSWSLPNSVLGSIWATLTAGIGIDKANSRGTGRLVLTKGVFSNYDTTFGNVIAGTNVLRHETVHVVQAWLVGPFFYPVYVANYVVNLVPYWLLFKLLFNAYPNAPIKNVGHYFTRGVYPFTVFEAVAYAVEGNPP